MKSHNHLFEFLINQDNIRKAIYKAFQKSELRKRSDVKRILNNIEFHISNIRIMLLGGYFDIQEHKIIEKQDKGTGKIRIIMCPYYYKNKKGDFCYEHIVHHLVVMALQQNIFKSIYDLSCGSIPDKGGTYARKYILRFIKNNPKDCKYCLQADIHHFYREINIDILKKKIRKKIHDERFLNILFKILDSNKGWYKGEYIAIGLPIGFYTSQWLANWFLSDYDHFIKEKLKAKFYVRYVDDHTILGPNKRELHNILREMKIFLQKEGLSLKSNYQIYKLAYRDSNGKIIGRPLDLLGYKFYQFKIVLRKRILSRISRKAIKLFKKGIKNINYYEARQFLTYMGWRKRTQINLWFNKNIKTKVVIGYLKRLISKHDKIQVKRRKCYGI